MAEKQITGLGVKAAPLNRTTKGSEHMTLLAVNANFDGSGAAVDFVPTVVVISDSGEVVGRFPANDTVPAGDNAEVTFAPFLRSLFGFIRFGRKNVGNWLNVRTTSNLNPDTGGVTFEVEKSEFGIYVTDAATGAFHVEAPFVFYDVGGGVYRIINSSLVEVNADEVTMIAAVNGMSLQTLNGRITLSAANDPITLFTPVSPIYLTSSDLIVGAQNAIDMTANSSVTINCRANVLALDLFPAGTKVQVNDQSGNPIFEVRADGSLHGKTGQALTFDL